MLVASCLCSYSGMAQVTASAALERNNLLIGDQVILKLKASQAAGSVVKDPNLSDLEEMEEIEVLNVSDWDSLQTDSGLLLEKNITITSFDSGYYYIPQIAIPYEQGGQLREIYTPQLAFAVSTLPPDTLELAPIKELIEEPFRLEDLIPLVGSILILGLLALLAYYFWKRRKLEEAIVEEVPEIKRPAHEIALERLQALKQKELWQKGKLKAYHSELTYIVREYLENRYEIQALESTTDEILRDLADLGFDPSWRDKLREMLQAADLVKFAKAEPPVEFHDSMWQYADDFVQATKKEEVEMTEEGEN